MKAFFRVLVILIPALPITQCEKLGIGNVDIPDKAFLDALIAEGIDTDRDGFISYREAEEYSNNYQSSLKLWDCGIEDLTGIEAFTMLHSLNCSDNRLTNLELADNKTLYKLYCSNNQIESLDVSSNTKLKALWCNNNQLTILDVSQNTELRQLYCGGNQLTKLDISNNRSLVLPVDGGIGMKVDLNIDSMSSLLEVCVWELPFPPWNLHVSSKGSPNIYYTKECSE